MHQASTLLDKSTKPRQRRAPWVTVSGGKGGVGKTTVAVNLALQIARSGYRVLLADLDPGLANIDVQLRIAPEFSLEDLAAGRASPADTVVPAQGGIQVLCGTSGSTRLQTDPDLLAAAIHGIGRCARNHDVVICDTGAGIGESVMAASGRADLCLAVTNPDPVAVTDAYALIKVMVDQGLRPPELVVNSVRGREHALQTATRLSAVTSKFLGTGISLAGWIARDPKVEKGVRTQHPFALGDRGPALEDLRALSAAVLSKVSTTRGAKRGRKPQQTPVAAQG